MSAEQDQTEGSSDELHKVMSEAEAAVDAVRAGDADPNDVPATDPSPAAGDAGALEAAQAEIEKLKGDVSATKDKWLRAMADHENYKKRVKREVDEATTRAVGSLLDDFLPVADDLDRALTAVTEDDQIVQGVKMVISRFMAALTKHGITPVEALGKPFDPALHDALQQVDSPDHAPGVVIQVFERGYVRGTRLLRPSRVIVAGAGSTGEPPEPEASESEPDGTNESSGTEQ